ncbi:MAG: flagellar biosynthesis protein FlgE [Gammaproteobacteria bacterium]|nr:flagellar biosynthesis protein FlgE [Gammaproteobacteria bacterium]NNJ96868.1 flagellar biosynthesis protein FlgE [Gammaproteobacteria bacterium]
MSAPIGFSSGFNGIRAGLEGLQRTANQIASKDAMQSGSTSDLAKSMIDLKLYTNQVDASAQVVKATDRMLGTLVDIKA